MPDSRIVVRETLSHGSAAVAVISAAEKDPRRRRPDRVCKSAHQNNVDI